MDELKTAVVLLSHGQLGRELIRSAKHFVPVDDSVVTLSLMDEESLPVFQQRVLAALSRIEGDMLILTDLNHGTPLMAALPLLERSDVMIVSGMNLMMVVEVILHQKEAVRALAQRAIRAGTAQIADIRAQFTALPKQENTFVKGSCIMENIALVRVDSRLLHGQVVTRWIGNRDCKHIIIADDELASDPFMSQVFLLAAPKGVKVDMIEIRALMECEIDPEEHVIILFKSIKNLMKAVSLGFTCDKVQIGGLGGAPGRKVVLKNITLTEAEVSDLEQIQNEHGIEVYLQIVPDDGKVSLQTVREKYF